MWDRCTGCGRNDDDTRWVFPRTGLLQKRREPAEDVVSVEMRLRSMLTYSLAKLKTPLTFRSRTFWLDESGVGSNGPPQVAPALHTRISRRPSVSCTCFTSRAISSVLATLAAIPTASPDTGSLFSFSIAWSMPCSPAFLRADTMTFFAPARRKAVAVCRPRPLDPGEIHQYCESSCAR